MDKLIFSGFVSQLEERLYPVDWWCNCKMYFHNGEVRNFYDRNTSPVSNWPGEYESNKNDDKFVHWQYTVSISFAHAFPAKCMAAGVQFLFFSNRTFYRLCVQCLIQFTIWLGWRLHTITEHKREKKIWKRCGLHKQHLGTIMVVR